MRKIAQNYYRNLRELIGSIQVTGKDNRPLDFFRGIEEAGRLVVAQSGMGKKMIFIGNGASAAIASHMSTDYWKNGGIKALAFNDSSLLTCISNDYGYPQVFEKPVEMFADEGDILFAISSSGKSENIIRAVGAARTRKSLVITLSGFQPGNPLRALGDFNFYVPAQEYGPVEILHHSICHGILDTIMEAGGG